MFVSFPKALGIFGSVLGVGGIGTGAVYATTQKTISDSLGKYRIVDKDKGGVDAWTKLKKKLDESNGTNEKPKPKSKVFIDLQNKEPKGELKDICQKSGEKIYWTIFSKDSDLMEDVKKFCSITIEEILSSKIDITETESNNSKSDFKKNIGELRKYGTEEKKDPLHKSLEDLYEKVKNKSNPEEFWLDLVKWCSKSYKSYFFNKDDVLWKNVETYCKKSTQR